MTQRIGHFASNLNAKGGIATYVHRLAEAQKIRGRDVSIISDVELGEEGLQVSSTKELIDAGESLGLDVLHIHTKLPEILPTNIPVVRTIHTNSAGCPSGSRYLTRQRRPCNRKFGLAVCTWGHLADHCGSRKPKLLSNGFRNTRDEIEQSHAMLTLAVSNFVRRQMVQAGCSESNVKVLRSPSPEINLPFSESPTKSPARFVFIGRIVEHKGLDWLVRAMALASSNVILDVAGDGNPNEIAKIKALAQSSGISDKIVWHGWLKPDEITNLILNARAVVFPSVWHEPAGLVTLESAACGRPVIGSTAGAIPEYALPEFATLVDPHDDATLAQNLDHFAENHEQANQLGKNGYHIARSTFSMNAFVEKQDEFYRLARPVG